jgi:hypothetical protein
MRSCHKWVPPPLAILSTTKNERNIRERPGRTQFFPKEKTVTLELAEGFCFGENCDTEWPEGQVKKAFKGLNQVLENGTSGLSNQIPYSCCITCA